MSLGRRAKIVIIVVLILTLTLQLAAQVPTQAEINTTKQQEQTRPGYFFYARPYEVTMTVNLWGEVPQQGVYVISTNTDIIQLLSYAGGPREKSNLEEVLLYRVLGKKDQKARTVKTINVRAIIEGKAEGVPLAPGDMIVVKRIPDTMSLIDWLTVVNTFGTFAVLAITIYNFAHK